MNGEISTGEDIYRKRRSSLVERLAGRGMDGCVIFSPANIYYLTGFFSDPHERVLALFLFADGETLLIAPALDREGVLASCRLEQFYFYRDHEDPFKPLKDRKELQTSITLGMEKNVVSYGRFERLKELFSQAVFADLTPELYELRAVKEEEEIRFIEHAVSIIEQSLRETVAKVRPGVKELELAAELDYRMKMLGAERPAFDTMVLTGPRSALPHGKPGMTEVREGDLLLFDCGVMANGYCSDITRTFVVGEPSEEIRRIYDTVLAAQLKAIEAVVPGRELGQVDRAARSFIESAGYGEYFTHRVGHGMGIEVHEFPSMHEEYRDAIRAGMVFTIEPGIYIPGIGGVRIEDDILVTESGYRILTAYPKELTSL